MEQKVSIYYKKSFDNYAKIFLPIKFLLFKKEKYI